MLFLLLNADNLFNQALDEFIENRFKINKVFQVVAGHVH